MSVTTTENQPKLIPFSTRRARGQCEPVVYWVRRDGEIMTAPHTDMKPLPLYERVECTTPAHIERMARLLEIQEEGKMRKMKVEEQLRALPTWQEIERRSLARLAEGCISLADEAMTQRNLASVRDKMKRFERILIGEITFTEGALEIERTSAATGMAQYQQKKVTLT